MEIKASQLEMELKVHFLRLQTASGSVSPVVSLPILRLRASGSRVFNGGPAKRRCYCRGCNIVVN